MNRKIFNKIFLLTIILTAGFGFAGKTFAFSASDLPNLKLWLDPSLGTYTNTGMTTPANTDGASVCGWADQSTSANNATGTACAVLKLAGNGINGHAALNFTSGNARLYTPSFLSSAYDHAVTIYVVDVPINGQSVKVAVANQGITNYIGGETDNATYATPWNFTANIPITGKAFIQQTNTSDQGVYITSEAINGSTALFRNNNILQYLPDTAVAGLSGTLAIGGRDSSTSFTWTGLIGDILIYNGAHTRAQQLQVTDYLLAKYGKTQVSTLPNVALQGNSLTAGNGASQGNTDVGTYIATTLGKGFAFLSHGIAGRTLTDMTTDATTEIDPSVNTGISSNTIIAWEGTNALNASTPAQIITQYQTYFAARVTAGWNKRIVVDVLPNCSGSGAYETNRLALNALLASAFNVSTAYSNVYAAAPGTTWADYLVKLTGDSTVGQPGQCSNATYYADGTHMTPAGYALIAPYFSNAVLLANDASVVPTITSFTIPSTATSLTVSISTFTATDNVGVTGYMATTTSSAPSASDSTWQGSAPTSYTFSSAGAKTLYAWVKDAAGNVSVSTSAPVTITLPTYTIGGTISGLSGTVVLQNNGGDNYSTSTNGSFVFATPLNNSASYAVTVSTQPSGQNCTVGSGTGTVSSANVTTVAVTCTTKTTPTISVTNSPVTYNTSPQAATVSGSVAGVVSNIKYASSLTVPTTAGTYAITADFVPTDSANYNSLTGASAGNFVISTANQGTLTAISTPSTVAYGTMATLSSSGGSGTGAVTFFVGASTGCNITGGTTLNINNASGTCTVTATKVADTNYNSATSAGLSVTLTKTTQSTLTFTGQTVSSPTTFSALSTTGGNGTGAVTYAVTTAGTAGCSITGSTLSYTTTGTCGVTATKATDSNYNSISSSEATFTINTAPVVTNVSTVAGGNGPIVGGGSISLPGQVKSRPQIIYPDGHIVYLDATSTTNIVTTNTTTNTNTTTSTATYTFIRDISLHATGNDVKALQKFLNTHGFVISTSGAGSPGKETTLFGTLTYKALAKFQKSVGLPSTGFFGPLTRAYISKH